MKDKEKKWPQTGKPGPDKQKSTEANGKDKKTPKRTVIIRKVKQGAGSVSRSGDFIGRLGTLLVMIVTSINTGTIMVTSFIEGVYWKGGVHAGFLLFIHIPMIAVMMWFMCKARMQAIYNKIRPSKPGQAVSVADVEDEVVVYEESVEVLENGGKIGDDIANGQKATQKITDLSKKAEILKQQKREPKFWSTMKNTQQINKAFDNSML